MSFRYGILNLLVVLVVLVLFFENYDIWTQPAQWVPEREVVKKVEKKPEIPLPPGPQKEPTPVKSYVSIAEKNIFNPERKDFPVLVSPGVPGSEQMKKPVARPQIVLSGITTFGDYQSATISTPASPQRKGERETMTIKLGDKIGEYKLSKILPDRITMEAGEDSFEILLYDPKTPRQRSHVKTEAKPATVTTVAPGGPAAASPAPGLPGAVPPAPVTPPVPQRPAQAVTPPPTTPPPAGPAFAPSPVFPPRPVRPRRGVGTSATQ
jgi:hypothetical protein